MAALRSEVRALRALTEAVLTTSKLRAALKAVEPSVRVSLIDDE